MQFDAVFIATVGWIFTIAVLIVALVACWRRKEVGFYLLTLNIAIGAAEKLALTLGFDVYGYGLNRPGSAYSMLMLFGHSAISLVAWIFLARKKNEKRA